MENITVGDIVVLRGDYEQSHTQMTVDFIKDGSADCVWLDGNKEVKRSTFNCSSLRKLG